MVVLGSLRVRQLLEYIGTIPFSVPRTFHLHIDPV